MNERRTRSGWVVVVPWLLAALGMIAVGIFSADVAQATVLVDVPLDDMIADADAVVRGRVERSGVRLTLDAEGPTHETVTEVTVEAWLKHPGDVEPPPTLVLRELGGVTRGRGMWIEGTPRYARGEEVVLFLRKHPRHSGEYRTYGMALGKFVVLRGAPGMPTIVKRDLEAVGLARWASGDMQVIPGTREPAVALDTFEARIRSVLGALGGRRTTDSIGGAR